MFEFWYFFENTIVKHYDWMKKRRELAFAKEKENRQKQREEQKAQRYERVQKLKERLMNSETNSV